MLTPINSFQKLTLSAVLMLGAGALAGAHAAPAAAPAPQAQAQASDAKGTVLDEEGEPMIGASVQVVGNPTKGAATDLDGNFVLSGVAPGSMLRISAVGYKPVEVKWTGAPINVQLAFDSEELQEVVVTAMGIQREAKTLTYATQTVKADEVTRIKSNNFVNALQGKAAGLTITPNNSGAGGGASKITLRGSTSILGTNQPLIVIDGVPMQDGMGDQVSADAIVYGGTRSRDDLLSTINPEDIDNMTILKGPNAAALYGSAANNGVIVITTKTGASGQVKVDVSSTTSIDRIATYPKTQKLFGLDADVTSSGRLGDLNGWGPRIGTRSADELASRPYLTASPRNASEDFFQTGVTLNNGITLSGGTDLSRTYFSYNNTYQTGVVPDNKFLRNNVMLKESFSLFNKRVNISTSLNWINQRTDNTPVAGRALSATYALYRTPAEIDMRYYRNHYKHTGTMADEIVWDGTPGNTYGNYKLIGQPVQTWDFDGDYLNNPYWVANMIKDQVKRDRLLGNITLGVNIWKNLKYQTRFSVDYVVTNTLNEMYANTSTKTMHDVRGGRYSSSNARSSDVYNDHMLTWNDRFSDKIDVSVALGGNFTRHYSRSTSISTEIDTCGLPNAFVPQNSKYSRPENPNGSATGASDSWNYHDWSSALFATASVGLFDKVYVDGSYRLEWAQSFQQFTQGSGYKSFDYYSAGVNVLLDRFFGPVSWLDQLKWRGSWSVVGNPIPNTLFARQTYDFANGTVSTRPPLFDDPKPETTTAYETGLDVWMFNNKFNFDLTYYNSTLKNQFMYVSTASGESKPVNTGKIRNYGLEFSASYRWVITNDWSWRTGFNVAWNDNRILETYQTGTDAPYEVQVGPSAFKVKYKEGGRYGDLYVNSFARDENGYIKLLNEGDYANAAPQMATGTYDTFVGNTTSPVTMGWNNTFSWRNLTLYFLIDGRIGGKVMSLTESDMDLFGLSQRTADARLAAMKNPDLQAQDGTLLMYLPDGSGRKVSVRKYYETIGGWPMEDHVYDATSFRMRDISLSYEFPDLFGKSTGLTAQFSVKNAFFIYKDSPVDPDISMTASNGLGGIDNYALPTTRSYAITLKLNF
ncbi:MAG: SusC/RagA family TonB-linked outer membrane protein [Muribaculaceae bacterium]|nr:SusC/RagA family TonB-linked outer membrane protein [Muribaculaceae bacterium]